MGVVRPEGNRRLLLLGTPAFVALMIVVAPLLGRYLDSLAAVLLLLSMYWAGACTLALASAPRSDLVGLYRTPLNRRPLEVVLTWLPTAATLCSALLLSAWLVPVGVWPAIVVLAIVNGSVEELFWRGAFVATFPRELGLAYLYPSVLFAVWHVAMALVVGMRYPSGPFALIGGAAVLGLMWGWVLWRTRDLRSVSAAHVITNVFAFAGVVMLNWAGR